jgi:hypothetical protein
MAQILIVAFILALAGLLWWRYGEHVAARWHQTAGFAAFDIEIDRERFPRPIHRASPNDFLHGAADITFGVVILALGFFMLMWMIATG